MAGREIYESGDGIFFYRIKNGGGEIIEYEGAAERLLLPACISGSPVRAVGKKAFAGKRQLVAIGLPDTLEEIGDWAFAGCQRLQEVALPQKQLRLGRQMFRNCTALQCIFLPDRRRPLARLLAAAVAELEAEYLLCPPEAGSPGWFQSLDRKILEKLRETEEAALRKLVYCAEEDMLAKQEACLRGQSCQKIRAALLRLAFSENLEETVEGALIKFLQEKMTDCREEIWSVIEDSGEERFLYCDVLLERGIVREEMTGEILEELGEAHVELRAYLLKKWQSHRKGPGIWERFRL